MSTTNAGQLNLSALQQLLPSIMQIWTMYLTFYFQIMMLQMMFGLLRQLFSALRLPAPTF